MSSEKRKSPRRSLKYRVQVDIGGGSPPFNCQLADISATGARVVVALPRAPSSSEILLLLGGSGAQRRCKVAWREGDEMGLEFVKERVPAQKDPPTRSARRSSAVPK